VQPWSIGIEYPGNLNLEAVLTVIVEKQGLGASLAFVITGPDSHGVHVAPIALRLGVHRGIPIHFRCGSLEYSDFQPLRETQHIDGTVNRRLRRLYGIELIVDGRSGTGQIVNLVGFHVQRETHVMTDHFEVRISEKMSNIPPSSRIEVIHTDDFVTSFQELLTKMGSQEAGSSGDQDSFL
jgi:hypothetical protein